MSQSVEPARALSDALANVVEKAAASVVRVEGGRRGAVSGVVWSADGHVLTADHALDGEERVSVGLADGATVSAAVVGRDPGTDLALLRLDTPAPAPPPEFRDVDAARVGELVVAVSRPGQSARAALGIIGALGASWRTPAGGRVERFFQPDVALRPGFSGSLLLDISGRALGVNSAALTRAGGVTLPAVTLRRVVASLAAHGRVRRGYLGIGLHPTRLPTEAADRAAQAGGLMVVAVQPGGPAEKDVLLGDVLLALDGQQTLTLGDLQSALDESKIGRRVAARLLRAGAIVQSEVSIGARP
jgi:S1-C subfamily serine protease